MGRVIGKFNNNNMGTYNPFNVSLLYRPSKNLPNRMPQVEKPLNVPFIHR